MLCKVGLVCTTCKSLWHWLYRGKESYVFKSHQAQVCLSGYGLLEPKVRISIQIEFVKIFFAVFYFCRAFLQLFADFKTVFL